MYIDLDLPDPSNSTETTDSLERSFCTSFPISLFLLATKIFAMLLAANISTV